MNRAIMLGAEALAALLPCALLWLWRRRAGKGKRPFWALGLFALYICAVLHLTGSGTLHDALLYGPPRAGQINLLPFSQEIDAVAYVQNVLLFAPLGFLLPWLWPGIKGDGTVCCGLGFSLLIEASQLCNNRRTDVDDLILNTLGAAAGLLAFRLARRFLPCAGGEEGRWAAAGYIAVMFLGRFLLYDGFGLAKALYGF